MARTQWDDRDPRMGESLMDGHERPGMSTSGEDIVKKFGVWVGLGLVGWALILLMVIVTVKAVQWLW